MHAVTRSPAKGIISTDKSGKDKQLTSYRDDWSDTLLETSVHFNDNPFRSMLSEKL